MIIVKKFYTENEEWNRELDSIETIDEELNKITRTTIRNVLKRIYKRVEKAFNLRQHFLNLEKFVTEHPEISLYSNNLEICKIKYSEKIGTEIYRENQAKNPFRNHKGRLSPFKKGSVNYSREVIEKASRTRLYTTRVDYYLNKGMSLEEAQRALTERQRTFSLEKCIKKYGKEEGLRRWKERQTRWLETLNNKTEGEKREINMKKHSESGNVDKNSPCKLYFIKFYNKEITFWKVGITTKTLEQRFRLSLLKLHHNLDYNIILEKEYKNLNDAFLREQLILSECNNERIRIDYNGFKTTEAFKSNVLEDRNGIYKIL